MAYETVEYHLARLDAATRKGPSFTPTVTRHAIAPKRHRKYQFHHVGLGTIIVAIFVGTFARPVIIILLGGNC